MFRDKPQLEATLLLLLFACKGLGVTRPNLGTQELLQGAMLTVFFLVTEGTRQMALLSSSPFHTRGTMELYLKHVGNTW